MGAPPAEFEHDRCQAHAFDGGACGGAFGGELAQGRADEDPDPLVGCADHGVKGPSHDHIMARVMRECHASASCFFPWVLSGGPAIRPSRGYIPQHPALVKNRAGHGASKDV
jgi:hypothetical protein